MGSLINLRIASLNCNGLNDQNKRKTLFEFLGNSSFTIILLQETKFSPLDHLQVTREWKNGPILLNSVCGKKEGGKQQGTAILFNTFQVKILNDLYDNDSRVIVADIEILGSRFHLVNTYFPNISTEKYRFIYSTYKFLMSNFPIVWGGDFNLTSDNLIDRWPPMDTQDAHSNHLDNVIQTFNLIDVCRVFHPNQAKYTFKRKHLQNCVMSRIDRILVSKDFQLVSYDQVDCVQSDHELIHTQLQFQSEVKRGKGVWKNNTKIYKNEKFYEDFEKFWDNLKVKKRAMYYNNLKKWWVEVKYEIKMWLIEMGKRTALLERREMNMMRGNLDSLLQRLTQNPTNKSYTKEYFDFKKKVGMKQLQISKEKILHENADKFLMGDRPSKDFFDMFKRKSDPRLRTILVMKDKHGVEKHQTEDILQIGHHFYECLFSKKDLNSNLSLESAFFEGVKTVPAEYISMIQAMITLEEVESAINSFKTGKTPGIDGLTIEFYKKSFSNNWGGFS